VPASVEQLTPFDTTPPPNSLTEAFPDLEEDVRQSIRRIVTDPFIPHTDHVRGFVYEVETGRLREVVA
jgi:carbonic anhydrase